MKKRLLTIVLCITVLFSLGAIAASAVPGFYCGGSEDEFWPVGDIEITWDPEASEKLFLYDGHVQDWVDAGYTPTPILPNNMISWVGGTEDNPSGGVPEGWRVEAFFVADPDYLYIALFVTDPDVVLVQDGYNYTAGDAFQMAIDLDRALGKFIEQDPDLFLGPQCIFYSFGPMGEEAVPVQIRRQNSDGNDGVLSEENGDGVIGSTFLTELGWCAEFAFSWNQLYDDFEYKAYADGYEISVSEGDPLEVGCALYYLNNVTDGGLNWAAGTLQGQEAGVVPELTWTPLDNGIRLFLPYNEDLWFNCEDIYVYTCAVGTPEPETVPPAETESEEIYTEEGDIPETNPPTLTPEIPGSVEFVTRVIEYKPVEPGAPQYNVPGGMTVINCGGVISASVGMSVTVTAIGAAWMLKKKEK